MKIKSKNKFKVLFLILVLFNLSTISASTYSQYSVKAIIPENQVDTRLGYFDLRLKADEKQTVQIQVTNSGDFDIIAHLSLNDASTSRNGLIQYLRDIEKDKSLSIPLSDIAKLKQEEIKIKANSIEFVDITIKMPNKEIFGHILGGIEVEASKVEEDKKPSQNENENDIDIENNFSYVIGMQVSQNDRIVYPEMNLLSITPSLVNFRPMLTVNLQNSEASIVKGMNIEAEVYKDGSKEVYKEFNKNNVDVAPNSNFNYVIDWNNQAFKAGSYNLKMKAEHKGTVWSWDKNFVIDTKNANEMNKESPFIDSTNELLYAFIAILLLLIVLLLFLMYKRRNEVTIERRKDK